MRSTGAVDSTPTMHVGQGGSTAGAMHGCRERLAPPWAAAAAKEVLNALSSLPTVTPCCSLCRLRARGSHQLAARISWQLAEQSQTQAQYKARPTVVRH